MLQWLLGGYLELVYDFTWIPGFPVDAGFTSILCVFKLRLELYSHLLYVARYCYSQLLHQECTLRVWSRYLCVCICVCVHVSVCMYMGWNTFFLHRHRIGSRLFWSKSHKPVQLSRLSWKNTKADEMEWAECGHLMSRTMHHLPRGSAGAAWWRPSVQLEREMLA